MIEKAKRAVREYLSTADVDPLDLAKCRALFDAWVDRYGEKYKAAKMLSVEFEFAVDVINPETGGKSRTWKYVGKVDGVCVEDNIIKPIEHKTCSEDIGPGAPYYDRLRLDSQVSGYYCGVEATNPEWRPEALLYDVIRKPSIKPKQIAELDDDGKKIVLDNDGNRVYKRDGEPRQSADKKLGYELQARIETPDEFEQRLRKDIEERPEFYYSCQTTHRDDNDIIEWMHDLWATAKQLSYAKKNNVWPRNTQSCHKFGECPYWGLCTGALIEDDYSVKPRQHMELDIQPDGIEFLTNSRINCYRDCPKKHYYSYERKLEPRLTSHALRFGSLIHKCFEIFLTQIMEAQNEEHTG